VGNPFLTDDAVGIRVVRLAQEMVREMAQEMAQNLTAGGGRVAGNGRDIAAGEGCTGVGYIDGIFFGDIRFDEVYAGGLRLMDALEGFQRAIIVDAIIVENARPGRAFFIAERDFPAARNLECTHDTDLVSALELGRACGMALPSEIKVLAVEVEAGNTGVFGESLTPEVEAALPAAARMVLAEFFRREAPDGVFRSNSDSEPQLMLSSNG